jgi:hypothetical protein
MATLLYPLPSLLSTWPLALYNLDQTALNLQISESSREVLLDRFDDPPAFRLGS